MITCNFNLLRTDSFCPEFDQIFRNKNILNKLNNLKSDEDSLENIIEKLVIISHLYDREFRHYLDNGVNPLKTMFNKKYEKYDIEEVRKIFYEINSFYAQELESIFLEDMKRIDQIPTLGRFGLIKGNIILS